MNSSPAATETVQRERRWMRPAGVAAIAGVIALIAGSAIKQSALEGDTRAEQLLSAADGRVDGELLLGAALSAVAFLAFAAALAFLYLAARARSERMLGQLVGLILLGGAMIAAGQIVDHTNYIGAADDFAASEAQRDEPPPADEEEAEEEADDRAQEARDEAPGGTASGVLGLGGTLGFAIGFLYTSLWSMRTGLLSRFWGSFGMASAVVLVLIPQLALFALIWFLALGLMLLGAWIGGRPPAWEAGRAVPWPKPGEQPENTGTVEGTGREATERPLPDGEERERPGASGPPPRKRKRRG